VKATDMANGPHQDSPMIDLGPEWDYFRVEIPFLKEWPNEQKREVIAEGLRHTVASLPTLNLPESPDLAK